MSVQNISKYVEDCLEVNNWQECFIVDVFVSPAKKIEVFLDSDTAVSYEICRKVSRFVEEIIDESKEFGEKYTLEVSSAGLSRPLKFHRQYLKNIGRKIKVRTKEGKVEGILKEVTENEICVEIEVIEKKPKKIIKVEKKLEMNNIIETKVKVSF